MSAGQGSGTIFLGRQAIFDRKNNLFAYELLFREAGQTAAEITNDSRATARVIVNTLSGVGMERVLGGVPGFVNMGEEFLMSDFVFLLSPEHFVLEILETVPVTPAVVDRCRELRSRGYRLALDDYAGDRETWDPLLPLVDFVKVDFLKVGAPGLESVTRTLLKRKVSLVAEKVEDPGQQAQAMELGYACFQGFFYARPLLIESRKKDPVYSALIEVLSLILSDGEIDEIYEALKPHIDLSVSLIKVANVVTNSPVTHVRSLRQAILVMGHSQMKRWIELLLFSLASPEHRYARAVFHLAITRARFMEILSGEWRKGERLDSDQAFMAGMLSLSESLMGRTAGEILSDLPVMGGIRGALVDGIGPLALLLALARSLERSDAGETDRLMPQIPVPEGRVALAQSESMLWADDIVRTFSGGFP